MGEYAAFPYLNHKKAEAVKPVFVDGPKPLSFAELYSPREKRVVLHKGEKSYWRTRDRIEYCIIEDRTAKLLIITCKNVEAKEALRTIFLKLDVLYYEVESKARDSRDALTKKSDRALSDDKALSKAVVDYVLARLNIKADPLPWPTRFVVEPSAGGEEGVSPTDPGTAAPADGPTERMCTFEKMSSDVYTELEIPCPAGFVPGDITDTKLEPTKPPEPEPTEKSNAEPEPEPEPEPQPVEAAAPTENTTAAASQPDKVTTNKPNAKSSSTPSSNKAVAAAAKGNKVSPAPVTASTGTDKGKKGAVATKPAKGAASKKVAPM